MDKKVRWSPKAASQLENICDYIAADSRVHAVSFAKRVLVETKTIPTFPRAGRIVPEYNNKELRERIVGNYRIIYRITQTAIEIVVITHGARLLPDVLE